MKIRDISKMTVKELKKYITRLTKKANTRLRSIGKRKRGVSRAVQEEIDWLKRKGIIGKSGKAIKGFRSKRKEDLKAQARELEYFNEWKGSEKTAVAQDKDYKKYQTFIRNNPDFADYSYQEWKDLVSVFGSLSDQFKEFGYEDMKQLHREATDKQIKKDFVTAMKDVQKKAGGSGFDQEDLTDFMRSELFDTV